MLKVQGCGQRCVRLPYRRWYQIRSLLAVSWLEGDLREELLLAAQYHCGAMAEASVGRSVVVVVMSSWSRRGHQWVGGGYRCANTSPTLKFVCGFTHWIRSAPVYRTARSLVPVRLAWLRWSYSRPLEQATLPEWESTVQWCPKMAAFHTLPERGAWALPGPEQGSPVARSKTAMWEFPTSPSQIRQW
jgi:hypothetical protein